MDPLDEMYWNPTNFYKNAESNTQKIKNTINDLELNYDKVMVCGRGEVNHPNFHPRFSTSSTDIESDLYVLVDHSIESSNRVNRGGNYALSIIVHPGVVQKIENIGGKIFWFSPEYLNNDLPKIVAGKFPKENSGLATISLASFFGIKKILLSGINFSGKIYEQFLGGKEIVFSNLLNNGVEIFSLDGIFAEKITFDKWCKI